MIERPNSIYDIAAMEKEHARFKAILEEDTAALVALYNIRQDNKGGTVGTFAKDAEKTNIAIEKQVKLHTKLRAEAAAVDALMRQRFATDAKIITSTTDFAKATARSTVELQKNNKEIKAQAAADAAQVGTRERAMAQIKLLTIQKDRMVLIGDKETKQYDELVAKINRYNNFLKQTGTLAEKQRMNVGNYSGSIGILKTSLDEVSKKIEANTRAGQKNNETTKLLEKEYKILNQLVESQAVGFASARAEILANQKALFALEEAGKKGTKVYNELAVATGKLQDQVGDLKARTKALGSDTFALDGLIQGAQTLAGVYGVAQGAAALFGEENEELQKTFVKLQAVMTIIQGLQSIQNALQAESTVRLLINNAQQKAAIGIQALKNFVMRGSITATAQATAATVANTAATNATGKAALFAAGSMKVLRFALIASGIGAILLLLPLAAKGMGLFGKNTGEAADQAKELGKAMERLNGQFEDQIILLERNGELLLEQMKQRGATEKQLNAQEIENLKIKSAVLQAQNNQQMELARTALEATGIFGKGLVRNKEEAKALVENLKLISESLPDDNAQKGVVDTAINGFETIVDNFNKISQVEFDITLKGEQEKTKVYEKGVESAKKADEKRLKNAVDAENKLRAVRAQIQAENANEILRQNENLAGDPDQEINTRLNAAKVAATFRKIINEQEYQESIAAEVKIEDGKRVVVEKSQAEKILAKTKFQNKEKQIEENFSKELLAIQKEDAEKKRDQMEKDQQLELEILTDGKEKEQAELEAAYNNDIIALNDRFEKGKISQKDYNKKREGLDFAYHVAALEAEIRYTKKVLEVMKLRGIDVSKELRALAVLELELSDLTRNQVIKNDNDVTANKIENLEKLQQAYQVFAEVVNGFLNAAFTKQKNAIQGEIDLIEKRKEADLKANDSRVQSDQDRAANAELISLRAQTQREQLERRQKEIDMKKAQAEKALAIFQITIATAVNIAKALTPFGKVLAAISGAAQLAIAIATPIPRYKGGRGYGKEEFAITGDGGVSEFIHREDGTIEKTPATDTLVKLMPKDKVYKDKRTLLNNIAAGSQDLSNWKVDSSGGLSRADMQEFAGQIVSAVQKIEVNTTMITKSGWHNTNTRLNRTDAWVNKYIKGK